MIKRKLIFCTIQCVLLIWLTGVLPTGCQDDWDKYGDGSSGRKVTVNLKLPVALATTVDLEDEIANAHFYAYGIGSDSPIAYRHITSTTGQQILIPVGKCDIYIVANYKGTKLNQNTARSVIEGETFTREAVTKQPFVMLGVYKGVTISSEGQIKYGEEDITSKLELERIAAKVTLKITDLNDETVVIKSIRVQNMAVASFLMPDKPYQPDDIYSETIDLTQAATDTCIFYLPEYIVNDAHKNKSTYVTILVQVGDEELQREYKIYIGDWFGYSLNYDAWDWEATVKDPSLIPSKTDPNTKIGLSGLSVTRNKHYIFTGTVESNVTLPAGELTGTVAVTPWKEINIDTEITQSPNFTILETELFVNTLTGVRVAYTTTMPDIEVKLSVNPDDRFEYALNQDSSIITFTHKMSVTKYEDNDGAPILGKATIKVSNASQGGKSSISKTITLIPFSPVAKRLVSFESLSGVTYAMRWPLLMGYTWNRSSGTGKYTLDYNGLMGKDPSKTYMGGAPPDAFYLPSCTSYFEDDPNDSDLGKGCWRLPTVKELEAIEEILLSDNNGNFEKLPSSAGTSQRLPYFWSSTEQSSTHAMIVPSRGSGYTINGAKSQAVNKSTADYFARCVRDNNKRGTTKATYLDVSVEYYELPIGEYPDNMLSTIPITYSSDKEVSIVLYDADGRDISLNEKGKPKVDPYFLGYNVGVNESLDNTSGKQLYLPGHLITLSKNTVGWSVSKTTYLTNSNKKTGQFYLFPNTQSMQRMSTFLSQTNSSPAAYTFIPPQINRILYSMNGFREFNLVFSAGSNLSKSVRIRVVNPVGQQDTTKDPSPYLTEIGTDEQFYRGFDVATNTLYPKGNSTINLMESTIKAILVPDTETGCGSYFEGAPSDPITGKGNWFFNSTFPNRLVEYVRDRILINSQAGGEKGETTEGDKYVTDYNQAYWKNYLGLENLKFTDYEHRDIYWGIGDLDYQAYGYNLVRIMHTNFNPGKYAKGWSGDLKAQAFARCVRLLNKPSLSLSDALVIFKASGNNSPKKISVYTSAKGGITTMRILPIGNANGGVITVDHSFKGNDINSNSGIITIDPTGISITENTEINLLIGVGGTKAGFNADPASETYRIIKVKFVK